MFGYIRPFKPELRMAEYDTYKAVYCGLCHQLGHTFGAVARMTLSYDFTFLALLGMAVQEEVPTFSEKRCFANPLKKCLCENGSPSMEYSAGCAMLLLYYKLEDDRKDRGIAGKTAAWMALPLARRMRNQAAERWEEVDRLVGIAMAEQTALEEAHCPSVDQASEPTAQSLAAICEHLSEDPMQRRILNRLGYLIGRFVYLCDALDDLEEDWEQNGYNPFLMQMEPNTSPSEEWMETIRQEAKGSLFMTIGEIAKTYELLTIYRYGSILSNVIYMGMKATVIQILSKKETNPND